ncbi:hypothetical protein OJJOAM_003513 [Cupriavidus sp. H18C1]
MAAGTAGRACSRASSGRWSEAIRASGLRWLDTEASTERGTAPQPIERQHRHPRREGGHVRRPVEVRMQPAQRPAPQEPFVDVAQQHGGHAGLFGQRRQQPAHLHAALARPQPQMGGDHPQRGRHARHRDSSASRRSRRAVRGGPRSGRSGGPGSAESASAARCHIRRHAGSASARESRDSRSRRADRPACRSRCCAIRLPAARRCPPAVPTARRRSASAGSARPRRYRRGCCSWPPGTAPAPRRRRLPLGVRGTGSARSPARNG